jgi:DNA helicase II / ATP-dependent DNA helicase PcrA
LLKIIAVWSKQINSCESFYDSVIEEIKKYVKEKIFTLFNIKDTKRYIKKLIDEDVEENISSEQIISNNIYEWQENTNIKVELGTIHSARGETHASTLYLETFYQGKYESESIVNQLLGNKYVKSKNKDTHIKETLKMAYVGMSRPKYLLCLAIHKDRFNDKLDVKNGGIWEIECT